MCGPSGNLSLAIWHQHWSSVRPHVHTQTSSLVSFKNPGKTYCLCTLMSVCRLSHVSVQLWVTGATEHVILLANNSVYSACLISSFMKCLYSRVSSVYINIKRYFHHKWVRPSSLSECAVLQIQVYNLGWHFQFSILFPAFSLGNGGFHQVQNSGKSPLQYFCFWIAYRLCWHSQP